MTADDDLLTPDDLAERMKISSRRRVVELCAEYDWPHTRIGRTIRFTEDQYAAILAQHTVKPSGASVGVASGLTARSARRSA